MRIGAFAAVALFILFALTGRGKNPLASAAIFAVFALALYIPGGYYMESYMYRRRQQRKQAGRANELARRSHVHGGAGAGELLHRARAGRAGRDRSSTRVTRRTSSSAPCNALGIETVEAILITHTHFDHIGAVAPVAKATGAPVYCPELETQVLANIMDYVPWPGFGPFESYEADHTVAGGDTLELAGLRST